MNNLSIKTKLVALSGTLLGLVVMLGSLAIYGVLGLSEKLDQAIEISLPAVRNMTLADMAHDGLRAIVYQALLEGQTASAAEREELQSEFTSMSAKLNEHLKAIDSLQLDPPTRKAISDAKPEIAHYVATAGEVVSLALSEKKVDSRTQLGNFNTAFKSLEEKLELLGDLIEQDAQRSQVNAKQQENTLNILSVALTLIGILFGLSLSVWIIRDLLKTLGTTMEILGTSSGQLKVFSSQSSSTSTELSEAATEQAASLQETMASIAEISAMVDQNAESARKANEVVDANHKAAAEGVKSIGKMVDAINDIEVTNKRILSQMEASNKEFSEIVKIISQIGEKTKVINDIVFQTKLLSFNASVEAARAGEHGKGFAVVAEEVGNLAQMSGNASKEISNLLNSSVNQVNEIVQRTTTQVDQLIEIGKDKVATGQATAHKSKSALATIADHAESIARMIREVADASREQAQGVQEINRAISQLDQVTQQNTAIAQQSANQAEQLRQEAVRLSDTVQDLRTFVSGSEKSEPTDNDGGQTKLTLLKTG